MHSEFAYDITQALTKYVAVYVTRLSAKLVDPKSEALSPTGRHARGRVVRDFLPFPGTFLFSHSYFTAALHSPHI